jgi:hypothetical protein
MAPEARISERESIAVSVVSCCLAARAWKLQPFLRRPGRASASWRQGLRTIGPLCRVISLQRKTLSNLSAKWAMEKPTRQQLDY